MSSSKRYRCVVWRIKKGKPGKWRKTHKKKIPTARTNAGIVHRTGETVVKTVVERYRGPRRWLPYRHNLSPPLPSHRVRSPAQSHTKNCPAIRSSLLVNAVPVRKVFIISSAYFPSYFVPQPTAVCYRKM